MKKLNLVAMIDGTWNDYESGTNVRRLHDAIVQGRPYVIDGGDVEYVTRANYERGPGTSPDVKLTGGAFASDLARAIGHSYDWLATRVANAGKRNSTRHFRRYRQSLTKSRRRRCFFKGGR